MNTDLNIHIIIGSTRQGRFGDKPAYYLLNEINKLPGIHAEIIDLRDWELPFFDEPKSPAMHHGDYSNPVAAKWAAKVDEADAYIIVAPEYNHGYTAVLKNALDWVYHEWNNKPVGFVGYGNTGGARSIEQLRQVVIELGMLPIKNSIHVPIEVYLSVMNEQIPVNTELFKPLHHGFHGDKVKSFFEEIINLSRMIKTTRISQQLTAQNN